MASSGSQRKLTLNPRLRRIKIHEHGRVSLLEASKARFQEPHAGLILVRVRELDQNRYEEAIRENEEAFGVDASSTYADRL